MGRVQRCGLPGSLLSCWAQLKTSSGPAMSHRSNLSCKAMRTLIGSKLSPSGSSTIAPGEEAVVSGHACRGVPNGSQTYSSLATDCLGDWYVVGGAVVGWKWKKRKRRARRKKRTAAGRATFLMQLGVFDEVPTYCLSLSNARVSRDNSSLVMPIAAQKRGVPRAGAKLPRSCYALELEGLAPAADAQRNMTDSTHVAHMYLPFTEPASNIRPLLIAAGSLCQPLFVACLAKPTLTSHPAAVRISRV